MSLSDRLGTTYNFLNFIVKFLSARKSQNDFIKQIQRPLKPGKVPQTLQSLLHKMLPAVACVANIHTQHLFLPTPPSPNPTTS